MTTGYGSRFCHPKHSGWGVHPIVFPTCRGQFFQSLMDAKDTEISEDRSATARATGPTVAQDDTHTTMTAHLPDQQDTRIEQAETRTEQAEMRTEQARTRTEQAEVRIEQAETRTEQAKTRTELAETRTEQAEAWSEAAVRESQFDYRRLFEAAKEGILILEADTGRISDVNPFLIAMLGFPHAKLVGTPIWELGPFRDIVANKSKFEQLQQQGDVLAENLSLETSDGRKIAVEFVSNVYQAGDRNVIQCNVRDITERKKFEEQSRQAQKMEGIGQLAGGVAHDVNNILAIIQLQAEHLIASGGLSAKLVAFAEEIVTTVQRGAALTSQLLLFSSREVFQPRDLDLSQSITDTANMLRRILGEDVQMQFKLASHPMCVHADAGMMDQVLLNLVVNARDAMPEGGQLVIETSGVEIDEFAATQSAHVLAGSFVCLSVSDSGCGIPADILPKIFEPFFTTKAVGKGTGLGLATVFGIAHQHQGWVNAYSEVGHGTTFRMYLPRLATSVGRLPLPPAPDVMRGGNETILLVEDDPSLRVSIRIALSELGYRILEAPTGSKALEVWRQNRDEIRLLLTDLVMPDGMTGKDLAQRILQESPQLKVIYMSGYSTEVVGKDFPLKEGVNFLGKPFRACKLAQSIRDSLDASA